MIASVRASLALRGLAVLAVLLLAAALDRAAIADSPLPEDVAQAKAQFTIGVDLFDQGDYRGAARAFAKADELRPNAIYRYNLGLAYDRLEDALHVVEVMTAVIEAPGSLKPERIRKAEEVLAKAKARIGELEIECTVDGARVDATDGPLGACPFAKPVARSPGIFYLHAAADGYAPLYLPIEVKPGQFLKIALDLQRQDKPLGQVVLVTRVPGASVFIDGIEVGETPFRSSIPVTAEEEHELEIRRRGYTTAKQTVRIGKGATREITLDPTPDSVALATEGARLDVHVVPDGARLVIDGQQLDLDAPPVVPPGVHTIVISRAGYEAWSSEVDLAPGSTRVIELTLVPTPETRADLRASATTKKTAGWALLGVGLGLVAIATPVFVWNRVDAPDVDAALAAYEDPHGAFAQCHPAPGDPDTAKLCRDAHAPLLAEQNRVTALDAAMPIAIGTGLALATSGIVLLSTGASPDLFRPHEPDDYANVEVRGGLGGLSIRARY